ncbi:MAG: F0F1 ATP synthase subunit B [Crocinitomicaceae bacterium]|jgi:F-type H+-transporting ATPase subunit b|nr:F0F1 ATP synthase subunit B [Crocinitomicaceae bacterium]
MDLILPDYGLLFWTALVFCLLLFLLAKFAWKPILNAVNARGQKIHEALELADKTRAEMLMLQAENEKILKEARAERDAIMNDAKETATGMVEAAKNKAKEEANKIVESAKAIIASEKDAAIRDLKNQLAGFSLDIAEKIVRTELTSDSKQKELAEKLADDINMN